ncbi:MAG: lytic transglycosylase domain-containing protein [Candidatus Binatia bacterium]
MPIRAAATIVWIAAASPLARAAVAPLEATAVPAAVVRAEREVEILPPEMPVPDLSTIAPIVPERAEPRPVVRAAAKPRGYDLLILEYARRYKVDAALVKAVIHAESRFDPRARSHKGAVGLMQLMPRTARSYGVRNLTNPRDNIRAGVQHLKRLLSRHHDVKIAVAAYNAGSHTVRRHGGVPPYPETRQYVTKVMRYHGKYQRDPLFSVIKTPRPVDRPVVERIHHEDMGTRG